MTAQGTSPGGGAVEAVIAKMAEQFGPGFSNGVYAILAHDNLPEHFDKSDWADWFFKPADAAFAWAHDAGLIVPWQLSSKWQFTSLGRDVAEHARAALAQSKSE
jgi:hypothetical protein